MVLSVIIVALSLAVDQLTKYLVVNLMEVRQSIPLIDGFLYLTSHRNAGAAWGIFQDQMLFFYVVTVLICGFLVIWISRLDVRRDKLLLIALSLLLGGALGNFLDRLFYQEVVDFADVIIFGYDFPIFNVADMALTFGVILMAVDAFLESRRSKSKDLDLSQVMRDIGKGD